MTTRVQKHNDRTPSPVLLKEQLSNNLKFLDENTMNESEFQIQKHKEPRHLKDILSIMGML
jgi:hypothetical protein